jgi:L-alanine-DL-glutamate epimerase-like enolase superfamily enzyme
MTERAPLPSHFLEQRPAIELGWVVVPITPFPSRTGHRDHVFANYALVGDGFGYALHMSQEAATQAVTVAKRLVEAADPLDVAALIAVEDGPLGAPAERAGACSISLAVWDWLGHALGTSCAQLWGGSDAALDCYSSYHLAFALDADLEDAARRCLDEGFRRAKMVVGARDLDADLARVRRVQAQFKEGGVGVDALHRWTPEQANRFMAEAPATLMWVEDAVADNLVSRLDRRHPLAGGESSAHTEAFLRLLTGGVSHVLPDLAVLGGPRRQLSLSRTLHALGASVGSHAFPYQSAHLLAAFDRRLPVEILDWADPLFVNPPRPGPDGRLQVRGPGFGVTPNFDFLRNGAQAVWRSSAGRGD